MDESHATDLAKCAGDATAGHGRPRNLLLAWALAGSPTQLAYRRYRAATGEWGEIRLIAGVEASDVTAEPLGTLPFSLAPNGVGGLLFKTEESGGESVKLLLFF